jgi:hypothetical protein
VLRMGIPKTKPMGLRVRVRGEGGRGEDGEV